MVNGTSSRRTRRLPSRGGGHESKVSRSFAAPAIGGILLALWIVSGLSLYRIQHQQQHQEGAAVVLSSPLLNRKQLTNLLAAPRHLDRRVLLPRVLAIVFPQFHRDDLNDRLWGAGFTDWDNLKAVRVWFLSDCCSVVALAFMQT